MKYFYIILLSFLLISCGKTIVDQEESNTTTNNNTVSISEEETISEIELEMEKLDIQEIDNTKVTKIKAVYTNPETDVDMEISYSLDNNGAIASINVSASNWDLSVFNTAAQIVIGKSIAEASSTSIAGSSLTTAAFQEALKNK